MIEEIEPADLVRRCLSGELWQLIDVREAWELEIARVEATATMPITHIPMTEIPARYSELQPAQPVAVLCHSGGRSARVAGFLVQQGFSRVANVRGGIDAWSSDHDPSIPRY
ncbi:MAG: rhodanese-like domain-containing protein [Woeseia sp.]